MELLRKKVGVSKPSWMSQQQWRELLARYENVPRCEYTKKTASEAKLVVDHIVPRSKGGKNEASNYQFLSEEENLRKWANEDKYWKQDFYYDKSHDTYGFRYAQYQLAYRKILDYAEHFQQPWSQINRLIYLLAWITGAGKTISIHAICFALNQVLKREKGIAYPRVDRILVLVKEQALRDQLAKELSEDVVKYGICKISPSVGVVKSSDRLVNDYWLEKYDIVVCCVQQIWKRETGIPRENIARISKKFPVIFFDEPHFAVSQFASLAELATSSLCFGLTSTPINAKGHVLESFILFSLCGLEEVWEEQKNLKYLSSSPEAIEKLKIIDYASVDSARVYHEGNRNEIKDKPDSPDYNKQIEAAKNVAEKVVSHVIDADRFCEQVYLQQIIPEAAPHREPNEVIPNLIYPMHAMISVKTKHDAEVLEQHLNRTFKSAPHQYPIEQGFKAEVVFSSSEDEDGKAIKGKKLETNHPWLKCWRSQKFKMTQEGWELPKDSARFLIAIDMGREGINNPFCGVIGLGRRTQSIIEVIQRLIGRQIRSYTEKFLSKIKVPPARLDTIKIWTHEAWDYPSQGGDPDYATTQRILDGLNFCEYMDEWLAGLTTLEDLITTGKELNPEAEITDLGSLTTEEKLGIGYSLGIYQLKNEQIDDEKIINRWCERNSRKRELGQQWLNLLKNDPQKANIELNQGVSLPNSLHIVERERPKNDPTFQDLRWFYEVHNPASLPLIAMLENPSIDDTTRNSMYETCKFTYQMYMKQFHAFTDLPKVTDFDTIRKILVSKLYHQLRYNSSQESFIQGDKKEIQKMANIRIAYAVKTVLGLNKAKKDSEHDIAQYHAVLYDPSIVRMILGYARYKLLQQFSVPLTKSLNIVEVE